MSTTLEYLNNRYFNLKLYSSVSFSEEEKSVFLPLWNLNGQMVGYQQVKPFQPKNDKTLKPSEQRYFTFVSKPDGKNAYYTAFGLELLNPNKKLLFVCEGVFDACRLHNLGLNALALLSCDPKPLKTWLWSLGYLLVPVCEGDHAGKKLAKLSNSGLVEYLPEDKDLGDLTENEVFERFSKYL